MTRDFEWLRAPSCSNAACVEVARAGRRVVLVQDSKAPASGGGVLQAWAPPEWCGLIAAIKTGATHPAIDFQPSGHVQLGFQHAERHELLIFDAAEWAAFEDGVKAGVFDLDKLSSPAPVEGFGSAGRSAGLDGTGEPSEAATGAGMAGNPPAPVAAESDLGLPPGQASSRIEVRAGHDPSVTAGELVPAGGSPTPCGPNVADPIVPAGRLGDRMSPLPPHAAGRPGPGFFVPSVEEVEELAALIMEAKRQDALHGDAGEPSDLAVARHLLASGYRREPQPAWESGPLVHHISDTGSSRGPIAVDAGSVPAQSGVGDVEGSAGPGLPPRGSGPAETPAPSKSPDRTADVYELLELLIPEGHSRCHVDSACAGGPDPCCGAS